jgi:hypothetical protein
LPRFTWSVRPRATSRSEKFRIVPGWSSRRRRSSRWSSTHTNRIATTPTTATDRATRCTAKPHLQSPASTANFFPVRPRRPRSLLCRWRPLPRDDRGAQAMARRANNPSSTAIFRRAPGRSDGRPVSPAGAVGHGCWRGGGDPVVLARVVRAWSISARAAGLPGDVVRQARASSPLRRGWMISST